jgi:trimethylamine--corrinoid protein Co-methyltransferase
LTLQGTASTQQAKDDGYFSLVAIRRLGAKQKGDIYMRANYKINSGVRFEMLSQDQLQSLFDGVLHVLEYTGLDVHHEEARDILQKAGAWVDDIRVRIPSYLVRRSLEMAPRSFTVFARDGNPDHDIPIGPGMAYFGPGLLRSRANAAEFH